MLVVGQKEKDTSSFSVRTLDGKVEEGVALPAFIEKVKNEISKRTS